MAEELNPIQTQTLLDLTNQTNKQLVGGNISQTLISSSKLDKVSLTRAMVGNETLETIFAEYNKKFDDIQNLVDGDDVIASFTEAANAIKALDGDVSKAVKELSTDIKNEVAFSQNQSQRFKELVESYNNVIDSFNKATGEVSRIKQILNDGVDPDTSLPLTQEQVDKFNDDLKKQIVIVDATAVYAPKSLTGFISYMEDMDIAKTEWFKNDIYWKSSFQSINVLETRLTESDVNLGVVEVNAKFIGKATAYMNGAYQHTVEATNLKEDGYYTAVTLPSNAIVGANFAVIALSPINFDYPKQGSVLASVNAAAKA